MTERVPVSNEVFLEIVGAADDELSRAFAALETRRCMDCQRRLFGWLNLRCRRCNRRLRKEAS